MGPLDILHFLVISSGYAFSIDSSSYLSNSKVVIAASDVQISTFGPQKLDATSMLALGCQVERCLASIRVPSIDMGL